MRESLVVPQRWSARRGLLVGVVLLGLVSLAWFLVADARARSAKAAFQLPELRVEQVAEGADSREFVFVARNAARNSPLEYFRLDGNALVSVSERRNGVWMPRFLDCATGMEQAVLHPGIELRVPLSVDKGVPVRLELQVRAVGARDWQVATIELGE